jgi:hypothetical protein
LRDGDTLAFEVEPEREPIDSARHSRVGRQRLVANLHLDQVVRHEDVPRFGERSDALRPKPDRDVAASGELVSVLRGNEPKITQPRGRPLLRRNVAANAFRSFTGSGLGRLHDDGQGHPVGPDIDLDVFVSGAKADLRLDEGTPSSHAKGRLEIDDVGDLRELRKLGADLESNLGQALHDELGEPLDGLADRRHAKQTTNGRRRHAPVDGARPALLCVDVPARASLEPGAARRREPPRVSGTLERRAHQDLRAVPAKLEVEARTEGLVAEAKLHHLRLYDHPSAFEQGKELAGVFPADIDTDPPRTLVLEPSEQTNGVPIRGRVLILSAEKGARKKKSPRIRIEQRDRKHARSVRTVSDGLDLQAVLDLLGRGGHWLRKPCVDTRSRRRRRAHGERGVMGRLQGAGPRPFAAPPLPVEPGHVNRAAMNRVVDPVRRRRRRGRPRLVAASLVAKRDQQGCDVLAVPPVARRESRARTAGGEAGRRKLQRDLIGLDVRAADLPASAGIFDDDVVDGVTAHVIVAAQIGARAEQAP